MINKRHWIIALLIAFILHAAAFITFASTDTDKLDSAIDDGEAGVEVDLGMLGDLGLAMTDPVVLKDVIAENEPKSEPEPEVIPELEPEPEVIPPEVVEPKSIPEPELITEPVKLDPKPVVQKNDVRIKKQVKATKVKKEIPKVKSEPIKPIQQKVVTVERKGTKSSAKTTSSTSTNSDKKVTTGTQKSMSTGAQKSAERSYFSELSAQLARHKRYPNRSRRMHEEGVAVLFISVNRDGSIAESYISKSSGFPKLDDAVLSMLKKASPLPAFLDDMKQSQISINIPIDFKLNNVR